MLGEPWPVKVTVLQAPQHQPAGDFLLLLQRICSKSADPPGDPGNKPGRGGAIFLVGPGAKDFVQRAQGQPTVRQGIVDRRHAKRQHAAPPGATALDAPDALLQINEMGRR